MPIRDNAEAFKILKKIDKQTLIDDLNSWINERHISKKKSPSEQEKTLLEVSPLIEEKYGFDIWDAMLLINLTQEDNGKNSDEFQDWKNVYDHIEKITRAEKLTPHLQDDFTGTNEFWIWCNSKEFNLTKELVENSTPKTKTAFFIVIEEVEAHKPSGRRVQIPTNC